MPPAVEFRFRADCREINADDITDYLYTPGLGLQYRWRQLRLEPQAGEWYSQRHITQASQDQDSCFINVGCEQFR